MPCYDAMCTWYIDVSKGCLILLMEEHLHQLISSVSHYLQGCIHVGWCRISSSSVFRPFD